jgi:hypothetical protein
MMASHLPDPPQSDEFDALEALRALVEQLGGPDCRDKVGRPIENNVAYSAAVALLRLHGLLGT